MADDEEFQEVWEQISVSVAWDEEAAKGDVAVTLPLGYQYLSDRFEENSKNGDVSYFVKERNTDNIVVHYEVLPWRNILDQRRSWLDLTIFLRGTKI